MPRTWDEARARILLQPRTRSWKLPWSLEGIAIDVLEVEIDPQSDLVVVVAIDLGAAIEPVTRAMVAYWSTSDAIVIDAARATLDVDLDRPWSTTGDGVHRSPWLVQRDVARMLAPSFAAHLPRVTGASVLFVDEEGLVLVGDADHAALDALLGELGDPTAFGDEPSRAILRQRAFRFDGSNFETVPFAALHPEGAAIDAALAMREHLEFAFLAKARRAGIDVGPATTRDGSTPPSIAALSLATVVGFTHHITDSEHREAGRPIPHEPVQRPVFVVEANVFDGTSIVPESCQHVLVALPARANGESEGATRALLAFDTLFELPEFSGEGFLLAGVPMIRLAPLAWDEAYRDHDSVFRPPPPNWEGPYFLPDLDPTWDAPDASAFAEPAVLEKSSRGERAKGAGTIFLLALVAAVVAAIAYGQRCESHRSLNLGWRALAYDAEYAQRPSEAAAFRHFAAEAAHRRFVRTEGVRRFLGATPLPDALEQRLVDMVERSERTARCTD